MAPTLPKAPLRSLSSTILPTSSSTTSSCTALRTFSTTIARHEVEIPPESPRFINLPELPQSSEEKLPRVKGVLPVPREIFHRRNNGSHKIQPSFIDSTAPRSHAEIAGKAPISDRAEWKRALAESRRRALASGIDSLWARKKARQGREERRAESHRLRNLAAANAPEALDDVFTRGTVTTATLDTSVVRDPEYKQKQLESRARTAELARQRSEARKDALQRLYVEAGRFIVTEEELAGRVEEVFREDYFAGTGHWKGIDGENIWDKWGPPQPVRAMFSSMKGTSVKAVDSHHPPSSITATRQKMIAGHLTGGAVSAEGDSRRR